MTHTRPYIVNNGGFATKEGENWVGVERVWIKKNN